MNVNVLTFSVSFFGPMKITQMMHDDSWAAVVMLITMGCCADADNNGLGRFRKEREGVAPANG